MAFVKYVGDDAEVITRAGDTDVVVARDGVLEVTDAEAGAFVGYGDGNWRHCDAEGTEPTAPPSDDEPVADPTEEN